MKKRKHKTHRQTLAPPQTPDPLAPLTPAKHPLAFPLLVTAVLIAFLLYFISISQAYPYYFVWDMDLVSCLDTVLMHSDQLPDHINHPGFGMYFLLYFTTALGHAADTLSVLDLSDIHSAPNPLPALTEFTLFLRLHSPFLAVAIIFFLWSTCCRLFHLSRFQQILLLLVLGAQESLVYHASMVRTEFYAVFYWSAAVLLTALAVKAHRRWSRLLLLLAAGLAAGLCLQTKLQALFYVAAVPLLLVLMSSLRSNPSSPSPAPAEPRYQGLILSAMNLLAYLVLGAAAWQQDVPEILPNVVSTYAITQAAALLFAVLVALLLGHVLLLILRRHDSQLGRTLTCLNLLATGFLLSFACHFLLYSDLTLSWRHLLYDFKVLFFRQNYYGTKLLANYSKIFAQAFAFRPFAFSVLIALTIFTAVAGLTKMIRLTKRQIIILLVIAIIVLANVAMGTRPRVRDLLWREMLMNFTCVLLCCLIAARALRFRLLLRLLSAASLFLLLVVNCHNSSQMPSRIDANFNHYGFRSHRWLSATFAQGNQLQYASLMAQKYQLTGPQRQPMIRRALAGAAHPERTRRIVDFVFKNQTITLRHLSLASEGFPVWTDQPNWRITHLPPLLRGAIIVDNASLPLEPGRLLKPDTVREQKEALQKFRARHIPGVLAVLTRRDLEITLFVPSQDVKPLTDNYIVPPERPLTITLSHAGQSLQMHGLRVTNYSEIPLSKITGKYFFVIHQL